MVMCGQVHAVESWRKVESKRLGVTFWQTWHDVGWQPLVILRQQRDWYVWWTTSPKSYWIWIWSPSRDPCGGRARTKMRIRQRWRWEAEGTLGTSLFVTSSRSWDIVFTGMGKDSKAQNELCARAWGVGGGTSSFSARGRCPCWKNAGGHYSERQHQLALECGHDWQGASMGSEDIPSGRAWSWKEQGWDTEKGLHSRYGKVGGRWVCRCWPKQLQVKSGLLRLGLSMRVTFR